MDTLRASHALLCVDVFVCEKRVGGHGTFMRVAAEMACKNALAYLLQSHAPDYLPLPDSTNFILSCQVLVDTINGKIACDLIPLRGGTVFFNFLVSMDMPEEPTKAFAFKCTRRAEDHRRKRDPVIVLMSRSTSGYIHLSPPCARSIMTTRDALYNNLREYLTNQEAGFNDDLAPSLGEVFLKNLISIDTLPLRQQRLEINK
jgi:hypothetical protein